MTIRPPALAARYDDYIDKLAEIMARSPDGGRVYIPLWRRLERERDARREEEAVLAAARQRHSRPQKAVLPDASSGARTDLRLRENSPDVVTIDATGGQSMADYREISQQYAQGGIKAALLINAGAAVALLSQLGTLVELGALGGARRAMIVWAFGVAFAAMAWLSGFLSTRYVDKSEKEAADEVALLAKSDTEMKIGITLVGLSILAFMVGCGLLAGTLT